MADEDRLNRPELQVEASEVGNAPEIISEVDALQTRPTRSRTTFPAKSEGSDGDEVVVVTGGRHFLCRKVRGSWVKFGDQGVAGDGDRQVEEAARGMVDDSVINSEKAMSGAGTVDLLATTLAGKADASHGHVQAEVQNLTSDLAARLTDAPSDGSEYVRKDGAWAVASGGGGGGYTPVLFQRRKTDGATFAATTGTDPPSVGTNVVTWDVSDLLGTGFSYSGGVVTIGSELNGKNIEVNVQINGDNLINRAQVIVELQKDSGGGYVTLLRSSQYNSRDSDHNEGATHINGFIIKSVQTGDKLRVLCASNEDGAAQGIYATNGCVWSMKTLS